MRATNRYFDALHSELVAMIFSSLAKDKDRHAATLAIQACLLTCKEWNSSSLPFVTDRLVVMGRDALARYPREGIIKRVDIVDCTNEDMDKYVADCILFLRSAEVAGRLCRVTEFSIRSRSLLSMDNLSELIDALADALSGAVAADVELVLDYTVLLGDKNDLPSGFIVALLTHKREINVSRLTVDRIHSIYERSDQLSDLAMEALAAMPSILTHLRFPDFTMSTDNLEKLKARPFDLLHIWQLECYRCKPPALAAVDGIPWKRLELRRVCMSTMAYMHSVPIVHVPESSDNELGPLLGMYMSSNQSASDVRAIVAMMQKWFTPHKETYLEIMGSHPTPIEILRELRPLIQQLGCKFGASDTTITPAMATELCISVGSGDIYLYFDIAFEVDEDDAEDDIQADLQVARAISGPNAAYSTIILQPASIKFIEIIGMRVRHAPKIRFSINDDEKEDYIGIMLMMEGVDAHRRSANMPSIKWGHFDDSANPYAYSRLLGI